MGAQKLAAIVLIVICALGLAYGGFSYASEAHRADGSPIHMAVDEKESVFAAIAVGALLLVARRRI